MSRILILIYILTAVVISVGSLFMESYPARFWIDLFAPEPGDKYPVSITGLLTILCLLLPLVILMLILKLVRNRKSLKGNSVIDGDSFNKSGIHFSRIKQLENRLISSPIFINGEQKGRIDSGKTAFIGLNPGTYEVEIGRKGERSDVLSVQVEPNTHAQLEIKVTQKGLRPKYVVETVAISSI